MPRVTVRYFAQLREWRGVDDESLEIDEGTTVGALYEHLFPAGPQGRLPVHYARNADFARPTDELKEGDEVVFIPPIGGG